jgi:hypothetical protein
VNSIKIIGSYYDRYLEALIEKVLLDGSRDCYWYFLFIAIFNEAFVI